MKHHATHLTISNAAGVRLLVLLAAAMLTFAGCGASSVSCSISGTVRDAETGKPIPGAVVSDGGYGSGAQGTTGTDGGYAYDTWYEEHTITASADGYSDLKKTLLTKVFGTENKATLDFTLQKK